MAVAFRSSFVHKTGNNFSICMPSLSEKVQTQYIFRDEDATCNDGEFANCEKRTRGKVADTSRSRLWGETSALNHGLWP
jgi:hypothetical protein